LPKLIRIEDLRVRSIQVDFDSEGGIAGASVLVEEVRDDGETERMVRASVKLSKAQAAALRQLAADLTAERRAAEGV